MLGPDLATVITFNPLAVDVSTSLAELLPQWSQPGPYHWPVVADDLRLVGLVCEAEVVLALNNLARELPNRLRLADPELNTVTAGQIMSPPSITISRWDSQTNGLYLLLKNRLQSLPVIDDERLIGLVTTSDYLREFSYGDWPVSRQPVSEWVQDGVDPLDCDASLDQAAAAMELANVEVIGVVNGVLPLGVINLGDVQRARCRLEFHRLLGEELTFPGPTTIRELASKSPIVRPGARLSEAADLMVQHQRQAIAVVTQSGRMVGVISEETLLNALIPATVGSSAHPSYSN